MIEYTNAPSRPRIFEHIPGTPVAATDGEKTGPYILWCEREIRRLSQLMEHGSEGAKLRETRYQAFKEAESRVQADIAEREQTTRCEGEECEAECGSCQCFVDGLNYARMGVRALANDARP